MNSFQQLGSFLFWGCASYFLIVSPATCDLLVENNQIDHAEASGAEHIQAFGPNTKEIEIKQMEWDEYIDNHALERREGGDFDKYSFTDPLPFKVQETDSYMDDGQSSDLVNNGEVANGSRFLLFAQSWPPTFCKTHTRGCKIPAEVKTWTVHGLWPDRSQGPHPAFCNKTLKYDHDKIAPFLGQMEKYYPNLLTRTSSDSFWKHEYEKHGTCATGFPGLETEENFFKTALKLREKYDMGLLLKSINIIPQKKVKIGVKSLFESLSRKLGVKPTIWCASSHGVQMLAQVGICFNRDMSLRKKCTRNFVNCSLRKPVLYIPFSA
eukprot:Nk52_evm9s349 gene=Nk52_evmTU9s349